MSEREVILNADRSTFWLRFGFSLRLAFRGLVVRALILLGLAVPFAWLASEVASSPFAPALVIALAILAFPLLVLPLLVLIQRSLDVSPYQAELPRRLVLRKDSIDVRTGGGVWQPEQRWTFIVEARETAEQFELILRREPLLVFVVKKARLAPLDADLLGAWLRGNGCLR